ncbi:MAG: Ser-Thr-rich GPI-anchored membrane family protein, partial [Ignavibacteriaceae bacterium]
SDGEYTWNIPSGSTPGSDYTVRISSTYDANIFDESDINFSLSHYIKVLFPNGGNTLVAGHLEYISWEDNIPSADLIRIELHKGGVLNTVLFDADDADGQKNCIIDPDTVPGTDYRIKIISVIDNSVFDLSDADFTIRRGNITITSTNGGEVWQAGTAQSINWVDDIPDNVVIDLYKAGVFHSSIESSTPSDGTRNWVLPFTLESGSDYTVKVTKVGDPNVFDFSDNNFTIVGNQVTVTSPNGGEVWQVGSSQEITWTDNLIGDVEIQLLKGGLFHSEIIASTISDGFFIWNIPDSITGSSDYSVKISSVDDGSLFDLSDANFTLSNELIVTVPNGGESWQAGSSQIINWTDYISGNVKIELFKGGLLNSLISASTPSDGSFTWDIPVGTATGLDYTVKITSINNSAIFDFSDANFEIYSGTITVVSPNGGENWQAGTSQSINWTDNISDNITIDLFKGGLFHSIISTQTASDGTRSWNIPFDLEAGTDYTVKVSKVGDPNVFDFSDSNFTIVGNQVTVTSPNGGENWQVGSSQNITWTDNLIGNVEIQLLKGGLFHSVVAASTPSDGSYIWTIPGSITGASDYSIKISSVDDGSLFDLSDANFTLSNELIVTVPNGAESWQAGSSQSINWTDNISENVKIELFKSGVLNSVIIASTASTGSYSWDIPLGTTSGSDYTIKITSVNNPSTFDFSDANFEIFTGIITVVSPNGGESWQAGTSQSINWTDNISDNITIDLYKGGLFHSIISTQTASDGTRSWNIPFDLEAGTDYAVKITSVDIPSLSDFSNANFTIIGNQITVTSPNGGENWQVGSSQIISWTDNFTGNVEIQLFKSGIFHSTITGSTQSDGAYTWNIPTSLIQAADYSIRISSVDDGNIFDFSNADFTLSNELIVTVPNGGESWQTGTSHTIIWSDNISENVKIELFKGGVLNSVITPSTPSDGSFAWVIPVSTVAGLDYTVKITSIDNSSIFDFSNNNFEVYEGNIIVTSPDGGESWAAGTTHSVTWTDNIDANVAIDLYKGGSFHSVISSSTGSDGSRNWDIPFTLESGNDYTVKITSVDDPTITDFSNANFTIVGNEITVTSPNGGEGWLDNQDQIITWTDNLAGNVEIQLFKNDVFHSSITTSTPSDGSYTWNIPGSTPSASDYKIKILSVDDGNIFDLSDGNFTIINNNITVLSPNGGESWQTGSTQEISWTDNITENVKIELYKNELFDSLVTASTPSDGSYTWDIPAGIASASDYKIKITSVNQSVLSDISNSSFTIYTGQITVTSPNGGESWKAGSSQNISWTDNIGENIIIDLYKGGSFHSIISTSTTSDGSKVWDIPFDLVSGSDYTVKITSTENSNLFDFSDNDFTIVGNQVTVTTPNGGENWQVGKEYLITWNDNFTGSVEIQLFKGGVFHSSVTGSTPSDGEYTWNIPGSLPQASDYSIKILSVDDANVFDVSNNFTLSNELIVTVPNGGEFWQRGTTHNITWTDNIPGNVKIDLYRGVNTFDSEITPSTPSNGSFSWDIPAGITPRTNYRIRITSVDNASVFDFSDANFTIYEGSITVTAPNGGESWAAGTTQSITWTDNIDENVLIDLYKGGTFHSVISTSTGSDGSRSWDIPFTLESGNDYRVRITSVDDPAITDFSNDNFTIVGNEITVTSPNGGENWQVGSTQIITWDDNLTGNVEIQLFKGGVFLSSITSSTPSDGEYTWNISSTLIQASDYSIRISSVDDGTILDFSKYNYIREAVLIQR